MGATQTTGRRKIHIDLPDDVHQKLRVKAALKDVSMQALVGQLVAKAVEDVTVPVIGEKKGPVLPTREGDARPSSGTQLAVDDGFWVSETLPWTYGAEVERLGSGREETASARDALYEQYADKLLINKSLSRSLVSFQSNKATPFYRWFKYKEAFSHEFVGDVLGLFRVDGKATPRVLDPFAGAGTTLTTATKLGWRATGVELLPVGTAAMRARLLADSVDLALFEEELERLREYRLDKTTTNRYRFTHLRITAGAFPQETEKAISAFMEFLRDIMDAKVRYLFWFAALSVLEEVSYTRKDGQYLRWDSRSGRNLRSSFSKGEIAEFRPALLSRLAVMLEDLGQRNGGSFSHHVEIVDGSCLDVLPTMADGSFDLVLTSPPYCNRYDYTRTYALELAFLGYGERAVTNLRQQLLSATVENKTKQRVLEAAYARRGQTGRYREAVSIFESQSALHEVLALLRKARDRKELNNANIPAMVEGYFYEMNFVIRELARLLVPGGLVVMVNDNVQYHGEEVPVDLILSDFAESAGLSLKAIWVLARGKGNSSQQMGVHGRNELRKCVYLWSRPATGG